MNEILAHIRLLYHDIIWRRLSNVSRIRWEGTPFSLAVFQPSLSTLYVLHFCEFYFRFRTLRTFNEWGGGGLSEVKYHRAFFSRATPMITFRRLRLIIARSAPECRFLVVTQPTLLRLIVLLLTFCLTILLRCRNHNCQDKRVEFKINRMKQEISFQRVILPNTWLNIYIFYDASRIIFLNDVKINLTWNIFVQNVFSIAVYVTYNLTIAKIYFDELCWNMVNTNAI